MYPVCYVIVFNSYELDSADFLEYVHIPNMKQAVLSMSCDN